MVQHLEKISTALTALNGGTDEIINIVNYIEALNTAIWQYGLQNLSEEVLGYQTKLNQLKNLELEVGKLKKELNDGLDIKNELVSILTDAGTKSDNLEKILTTSKENTVSIEQNLTASNEAEQEISTKLSSVTLHEKNAMEYLANIKAKNEDVVTMTTTIKDFHNEVDQYKKKIT